MKDNWDTRTAKTCRLSSVLPGICYGCRDRAYCFQQMTIDDLIKEGNDNGTEGTGREMR